MSPEEPDDDPRPLSTWADVLDCPLPNDLYHYTSLSSLLAIVSSRTMWAGRIQFLNDSQELRRAYRLFQDQLDFRFNRGEITEAQRSGLREEIEASRRIHVYIASFSARVDVLSQWRAYGHAAVAFFPAGLRALAAEHQGNLRLLPVIYDPDLQVTLADQLIDYCCAYQPSSVWRENEPRPTRPVGPFGTVPPRDAMALAAPLFKHYGFAQEEEWRFIYFPVGSPPHLQPRVRLSGDSLVPYVEIALQSDTTSLPISHVSLGPLAATEENKEALEIALHNLGIREHSTVLLSDTPLRR